MGSVESTRWPVIAERTEIKHFLQSLITEDDHQAADCKAMAQLKAY